MFTGLMMTSISCIHDGIFLHSEESKRTTAQDPAIIKCLNSMNEALATKDLKKVMAVYDDSENIVVVGSDSAEIFIGKKRVEEFMSSIVGMPFIFSFEMDNPLIQKDKNVAWVFIDSKMVHTGNDGEIAKIPYRVTAILVKRGNEWKWRMFSGSIPRGE